MKFIACAALLAAHLSLAATGPVASWDFEQAAPNGAGVRGRSLLLNGLSTQIVQPAGQVPRVTRAFTVQAWVALGAYPLNTAPFVDLLEPTQGGFFFGVDIHGRPSVSVRAGDGIHTLVAPDALPLHGWQQVAAVLTESGDLQLFRNGQKIAEKNGIGRFVAAPGTIDLLIGRARAQAKPSGAIRLEANAEIHATLDGALDELKIHDRALDAREIAAEFAAVQPTAESPVPLRVLPTGPAGAFGAFYTQLKFYPQWDATWRVGNHPDVVVRFGELPIRFVFWRGTSFIPHWVTENGIWYNNEFCETWGDVKGCGEPMSDKQTRYSHVRVLESNAARSVVHWRYALTDVFYDIARQDPATGWGDWADEVYTIYPDGTAVRDITLHSSEPAAPHEWHESIVVMGQGFSPHNAIEPVGLTLIGDKGERVDYSWEKATPPKRPGQPERPMIHLVNTKSRYRPFAIVRPQDKPTFDIFNGEIRREVSIYPWWNHWPAATFASDGRYAVAADRVSHSSLSHLVWNAYETGLNRMRKIMLVGLTEQSAEALVPLARSWSQPAGLELVSEGLLSRGYDPAQKAYILQIEKAGSACAFTVAASPGSPVVNPAFVLQGWGQRDVKVLVNGENIPEGANLMTGHRQTIDGDDLIVWLRIESRAQLKLLIEPR